MTKKVTTLLMVCFAFLACFNANAEDKIPIAIFDFGEGDGGWTVKEFTSLSNQQPMDNWYWKNDAYRNVPAGTWATHNRSVPSETIIRNTLIFSPILDLNNKAEVEAYLNLGYSWGTEPNNHLRFYVQNIDSLDLTQPDDTLLIQQWAKTLSIDASPENFVELGLTEKPVQHGLFTAGPLNLAKFDGKKIRLAFHMWNDANGNVDVNYRNYFVRDLTLAALTDDAVAPVGSITNVDSIGNTFMRAHYTADELGKLYWCVMPKGQQPTDFDDLVNNIGTDKFVSSGDVDYNIPGSEKSFMIKGLSIDTEYTISYVAQDYKKNKTGVQTIDEKTIMDLTPPVVTSVTASNISEITADVNIASDETGIIRYRVYEAGLEPADFDQFFSGNGSVIEQDIALYGADSTILLEGLTLNTSYIVYAVVTDMTGNVSAITKSAVFTTLADSKAPVITSLAIDGITNHTATLKVIADEPIGGYGPVTLYWSATAPGVTLSAQEIMERKSSLASGMTTNLDSATYESSVAINNLSTNTSYTLHVTMVDASENVSDVSTIALTTLADIENVTAFKNDFNVEGQNYHFIEVLKQEGAADHWQSLPNENSNGRQGAIYVTRTNLSGKGEEAWAIIGPMNLKTLNNMKVSTELRKNYGGDKRNSLSILVSKKYKPEDGLDQNLWSEVASVGDMTIPQKQLVKVEKEISPDLGVDTVGVYFAIRFKHNSWALNYNIYNFVITGDLASGANPPIIDWVEVLDPSSTSATVSFTADSYGRMFYYLLKDNGEGVSAPDLDKAKSGEGADVFGYKDYTAGNFIDQKFNVAGLEPSSKYYLYTTFRSNLYAWADEVFFDEEVNVFNTAELSMTHCDTSMVYATSVMVKTAAETSGRIYYTVKPAGAQAPTNIEEIKNSFNKKGNVNYNITDGTALEWNIKNLSPYTKYDLYVTLGDNDGEYGSEITKIPFSTLPLKVDSVKADDPVQVSDTVQLYNISFTASTSDNGMLYMSYTAADAPIPTPEKVMSGEGAIRSVSAEINNPLETIVVADSLEMAQTTSYEAWFVIKSGNKVSKVFALNQVLDYTYNASFKVVDLATGTPLQGVTVKLGETEMVTNNKGNATFADLTPATYNYEISRADLLLKPSGSLVIFDKNETVNITIDTDPAFAAMFTVLDNAGAPVSGATIAIGDSTAVTAADGKASISLKPGEYDYVVSTTANPLTVEGKVTITDMEEAVAVEYDIHDAVKNTGFAALEIYPNPASDFVRVKLEHNAQVSIIDLAGKVVSRENAISGVNTINTSALHSGIYMIKLTSTNGDSKTAKLTIK